MPEFLYLDLLPPHFIKWWYICGNIGCHSLVFKSLLFLDTEEDFSAPLRLDVIMFLVTSNWLRVKVVVVFKCQCEIPPVLMLLCCG